ncbi:MAG: hypothetical protein AAGI53_13820 [Planctomycetota bacterium]
MFELVLLILLVIVGIPAFLVVTVAKIIRGSADRSSFQLVEDDRVSELLESHKEAMAWGEANGFVLEEIFLHTPFESAPSFEILLFAGASGCDDWAIYATKQGTYSEFTSYRKQSGDRFVEVSSGNGTGSGTLEQPPNCFAQCFPDIDRDTLFERHLEATEHVASVLNAEAVPIGLPLREVFLISVATGGEFMMSKRLWPLRAAFAFVFRRGRYTNRTVMDRFPDEHPKFDEARAARSALATASSS